MPEADSLSCPVVLADLDDTLFQTARKMSSLAGSRPVATKMNGEWICFQTPAQQQFTDWLLATTELIPVTARSVDAFQRVQLPFNSHAVCSNGAVILRPDGEPDQPWLQKMMARLQPLQPVLADIHVQLQSLAQAAGQDIRNWIVEEPLLVGAKPSSAPPLGTYVVVKHNQSDAAALVALLHQWQAQYADERFYTHTNDNNLAIIPTVINKRAAAQYLLASRDSERPVLSFGDSLTDFGFMQLGQWWATPVNSQLEHTARLLNH